jgi:hypothetical protein
VQLFTSSHIRPHVPQDFRELLLIHGGLMLFCWVFLAKYVILLFVVLCFIIKFAPYISIGTFIARYLKDVGHKWYLTHRAFMSTVVISSVVALALSFYYAEHKGEVCICVVDLLFVNVLTFFIFF